MRQVTNGAFWISIYLMLVLAPLFVLIIGPTPPGRNFWREFSVALGFVGLAMMGMQFLLTTRFRRATLPFGIDVVYHFHRQISLVAFGLILTHPLLLFITSPETLTLLNPFRLSWLALAGVSSLLLFALLIALSLWRLRLRISYEVWRITHGLLATGAVALAFGHIISVGYYLSEPYKRGLWILLGAAWIGALAYIRVVKPILELRYPFVVDEVIPERGDTWTLVLRPEGHKGFRFKPGQFAWLTVLRSPFAIREHPFSFSSSAMQPARVTMSIKALGDFTTQIREIEPGARAYLDGPYGAFSLDNYRAPGYVFIVGGVGITPVMSMLQTLADRQDKRPLWLFYGSRSWDEVTFREQLAALQTELPLQVVHVLQTPPADWTGESGYVTTELLARHLPVERLQYEYFICGPPVMMSAVEAALAQLGIPLSQTQMEVFNLV
ncbi:MAG: oxidoreductase [Caldilinea sp. CFX5]|nr:oxidoreductase [Caldilinea sp. CFX5]